jgi:hypothetical protein
MKTVYELSPSDLEEAVREWVERKKPGTKVYDVHFFQRDVGSFANVTFAEPQKGRAKSTARSAKDILGGSGGTVDRSSGLSEAFDEDDE